MEKDQMLTQEKIIISHHCKDWQDAISQAAEPLVKTGSILPGHVPAMVKIVEDYGPYILIIPNVAVAHAAPSENVLKNDLSLMVLEEGVNFGSLNDPAKLVFCLSAVDHSTHLTLLGQLANLLEDREVVDRLIACETSEEAATICNPFFRKEEC